MSKLFKIQFEIFKLPQWMVLNTCFFSIGTFCYTLSAAYIIQLKGLYITLAVLSIYEVVSRLVDLILPYTKHISLRTSGGMVLFVDTMFLMSIPFLWLDEAVFIYMFITFMVVNNIVDNIFGVNYDDKVSSCYEVREDRVSFKEVQIAERSLFTIVGLIGSLVATMVYTFTDGTELIRMIITVTMVVSFVSASYLYKNDWSRAE